MTVRFRCEACGKPLKASEGSVGRQTACPGCGAQVKVPGDEILPSPVALDLPLSPAPLQAQVDALRRSLAVRTWLGTIGVALALVLPYVRPGQSARSPVPSTGSTTGQTLIAKQFVVADENGKFRAFMGLNNRSEPVVAILDNHEALKVSLSADAEQWGVSVFDQGVARAKLSVTKGDFPGLSTYDPQGRIQVNLASGSSDSAQSGLTVFGRDGRSRIDLSTMGGSGPALVLVPGVDPGIQLGIHDGPTHRAFFDVFDNLNRRFALIDDEGHPVSFVPKP